MSTAQRRARAAAAARPAAAPDEGEDRSALRLWLRLLACSSLVEREVRARLRERFDTTLPRFDVLAQLDAAARAGEPGLTMSTLSRRLMVTNGNLTGLVERLVQEGLVHRASAAHDRRVQLVRLTPAGRRAFDAMTPEHRRWIDELFAGLTADERATLHELLGRLRGSIRQSPDEEAAP